MAVRKTALSIPEDLLTAVDEAAEQRGESRSRYITTVLREAVKARRDADVTRRLNRLFADPEVRGDQSLGATALDEAGSDWSGESW